MNDSATTADDQPPAGFVRLPFGPPGGFMDVNGPVYGKRAGDDLVLGFRCAPRHCNPAAICHGGMLMTFADMLLSVGVNFRAEVPRFLPTVAMTCDFLAASPLGAWIEGRAEMLRTTRNLVFVQCLVTADAVPVVRASGVFKQGPPFDFALQIRALLP